MREVSFKTLVFSAECDFQYGGCASHSAFSSAALSSSQHRTAELHADDALYLFDEPAHSMEKHLREKVYLQGCRAVDVGAGGAEGKECLALFLSGNDYAERVDDFGNVKGHLFTRAKATGTEAASPASSGSPVAASPLAGALPTTTPRNTATAAKSSYMVLLYLAEKTTKWRLLKLVQRHSGEYPELLPPAANGYLPSSPSPPSQALGTAASGNGVPNRFKDVLARAGHVSPPDSPHTSDSVLSDHEVLRLEDVLQSYEESQQSEGARVGSFAGPRRVRGDNPMPALASSGAEVAVEEGILPPESSLLADPLGPAHLSSSLFSSPGSAALRPPARLLNSPLYAECIDGQPENQACADCGEPFPMWCVLQPFGAFVCIGCIGVHRQLWPNRCREAELDRWPAEDVAFMAARGNAAVNAELEFRVAFPAGSFAGSLGQLAWKPAGRLAPAALRRLFIEQKYEERLFTADRHPVVQGSSGSPAASPLETQAAGNGPSSAAQAASPVALPVGFFPSPPVTVLAAVFPHLTNGGDDGPPQYSGLADILVKDLVTPGGGTHAGATCVITNGYQALHTKAGRRLVGATDSTAWDEHLQVGLEAVDRPLYCAIYNGRAELIAAAEFYLPAGAATGETCMTVFHLPWCELNKKSSARQQGAEWQLTMLTSFRLLA